MLSANISLGLVGLLLVAVWNLERYQLYLYCVSNLNRPTLNTFIDIVGLEVNTFDDKLGVYVFNDQERHSYITAVGHLYGLYARRKAN